MYIWIFLFAALILGFRLDSSERMASLAIELKQLFVLFAEHPIYGVELICDESQQEKRKDEEQKILMKASIEPVVQEVEEGLLFPSNLFFFVFFSLDSCGYTYQLLYGSSFKRRSSAYILPRSGVSCGRVTRWIHHFTNLE
jgi:hypothetical protein